MGDKPEGEAADKKPQGAAPEGEADKKPGGASASEGEVDWKNLLHIEREGRLTAERDRDSYKGGVTRLEDENKRLRKGREDHEEGEDDSEDKPITRRDLKEVIDPIIGQNRVDSILNTLVTDPSKRAYVRDLYENRIRRTGTSDDAIRSDIDTAIDLADSKKLRKENGEIKRMNDNNRIYVPPADGGGNRGGGGGDFKAKTHEWTPQQEAALEQRAQSIGLSGDAIEKYKTRAWTEFQSGTAFAVKPKPKN